MAATEWRSAPAQKASVPAPVITRTRAESSSRNCVQCRGQTAGLGGADRVSLFLAIDRQQPDARCRSSSQRIVSGSSSGLLSITPRRWRFVAPGHGSTGRRRDASARQDRGRVGNPGRVAGRFQRFDPGFERGDPLTVTVLGDRDVERCGPDADGEAGQQQGDDRALLERPVDLVEPAALAVESGRQVHGRLRIGTNRNSRTRAGHRSRRSWRIGPGGAGPNRGRRAGGFVPPGRGGVLIAGNVPGPPVSSSIAFHLQESARASRWPKSTKENLRMPEAVIVDTVRTPIGRAFKGSLSQLRPDDIGAWTHRPATRSQPGRRSGLG